MSDGLIEIGFRSLALAGFGLAGLLLSRRCSASVRHAIVTLALAALLVLPVEFCAFPRKVWPVLKPDYTVTYGRGDASTVTTISPSSSPVDKAVPTPIDWLPWIWGIGTGLILIRFGLGFGLSAARVRYSMKTDRSDVRVSPAVSVPMTVWAGRHHILLPTAASGWTAERLDVALLHERAHVRRGDWWTQALANLAVGLLWPNPLIWVLRRQAKTLAEEAADDLVLATGVSPTGYAQQLLSIARQARATGLAVALPMAEKADVARRIEMLLDEKKPRRPMRPATALGMIALFAATSLPVATWALGPEQTAPTTGPARSSSDRSPTRYMLRCKILTGPAPRPRPKAIAIVTSDKLIGAEYQVTSSPNVMTLSGKKATISLLDRQSHGYKLEVTPTKQLDGSVKLDVKFTTFRDHESLSLQGVARISDGESMLLFSTLKDSKSGTYVLIRPSKVTESP